MAKYLDERVSNPLEAPVSVSHLVRILRSYLPVIALALGAVMVGYVIVAATVYTLTASQEVTTLRFRVDFRGAEQGQYPNGTKFTTAEIINTPVLLAVFQANELDRYMSFPDFTKSVFVLETNTAQEALAREYQAKLADPKLTPVDRDRLQREYELKLASLSKGQYSVNFLARTAGRQVPSVVVRKVLQDILHQWARFVSTEQHVLEYRVALVSPNVISATTTQEIDPMIATQVLRTNVMRIQTNIDSLGAFPSAEMIQSRSGMSLLDINVRLDDLLRFRLDPLVQRIAAAGLFGDRESTIRFLETQVAYDQRKLDSQRQIADSTRGALTMYLNGRGSAGEVAGVEPTSTVAGAESKRDGGTVMPQLSETFLDRLVDMASNEADTEYRQRLTDQYRDAMLKLVPLQQAVAYDQAVLDLVRRTNSTGSSSMDPEAINREIADARNEIRDLLTQVHQIYATLSRNLNPATELLTPLGAPTKRRERSIPIKQLALYGILTCFIALPIIVGLCLLHNRVREEEAAEAYIAGTAETAV